MVDAHPYGCVTKGKTGKKEGKVENDCGMILHGQKHAYHKKDKRNKKRQVTGRVLFIKKIVYDVSFIFVHRWLMN